MQKAVQENTNTRDEAANLRILFSKMLFLEQFVESVISYSSKYNSILSILYAPENLIGKPAKYPNYGDFPDTYMLRSYGRWWNESEGAQPNYMPQDLEPIVTEDFVTVRFEYAVVPKTISIYETYNPGAVVRLWARTLSGVWLVLWQGKPQSGIRTPRKFSPPIRQIRELVHEIRLDFNKSLLEYHTSIDAVLLAGYKPKTLLQKNLLRNSLLMNFVSTQKEESSEGCDKKVCDDDKDNDDDDSDDDDYDLFTLLPYEVMIHMFQYLDLQSLCRSAQVCKKWHAVASDAALYHELSLKRYWHKTDNALLMHFTKKCKNLKKFDISWCGNERQITEDVFLEFLRKSCPNLTHLSIGYCTFMRSLCLETISNCRHLTDLRLRNCQCSSWQYSALTKLNKLTALDLYSSSIIDEMLIPILMVNPGLKHLILDFCEHLDKLDSVAEAVKNYNWHLVTWSSWKTHSLTSIGVGHLSMCSSLRELDVGWCLLVNEPGDCLERIAMGCKDLRRLIISGWRGVTDHLLLPIIRSCKQLTQLDLLGIKNLSGDICEIILASLLKLKLLDISFCDQIQQEQVDMWRLQYPDVVIQRSISP